METDAHTRPEAIFAPGLSVENDTGSWWRRVIATLFGVLTRPNASFLAVEEPVSHGPVLAFIVSLRLPTWGVLVLVALIEWFQLPTDAEAPIRVTAATQALGLQLGQVVAVWAAIVLPLRIPTVYFAVGLAGHMSMTLTGGAHRSIGASMRALGFAFAPTLLVVGILELLAHLEWIEPSTWLLVFGVAAGFGWLLAAFALARTHGATWVRGLLVAVVPLVLLCAETYGAALLQLPWDPLAGPPPPADYQLPLPPP